MAVKGVDVEALRSLVRGMFHTKSDLESVVQNLTRELHSLHWVGPDRDRFLADWNSHVGHIQSVCRALATAATDATAHAKKQEAITGGTWR